LSRCFRSCALHAYIVSSFDPYWAQSSTCLAVCHVLSCSCDFNLFFFKEGDFSVFCP
jgi:hypothetical protein